MLVNHLGEDIFKLGLRRYLKKFKYSNATTKDLWNSLSEVSSKANDYTANIDVMMKSWTTKTGYPLLTVKSTENGIQVKQQKYTVPKREDKQTTCLWTIPLNILNCDGHMNVENMLCNDSSYMLKKMNHWFKLNNGTTGFYRTKYSPELLNRLGQVIKDKTLDPIDRLELISNLFAFSISGYNHVTEPLNFLNNYQNEDNHHVLTNILSYLNLVQDVWHDNLDIKNYVRQFGLKLIKPLVIKLGWSDEGTYETKLLRNLVISTAGKWEDVDTLNEARLRVSKYLNNDTSNLSSNLIKGAFVTVMKYGNRQDYDKFIELYLKTDSDEIKQDILLALGSVKDKNLLKLAFNFAFNSEKVRSQDSLILLYGISGENTYYTWKLIEDNWSRITKLYKSGSFLLGRVISSILSRLINNDELQLALKFLELNGKDVNDIQNTIKQNVEKAKLKIKWYERDTNSLRYLLTS
jgi:puromycin-sensitive aminopeptidase